MLMADKLLVRKSERRLYVMRAGQILREYRVALGLNPQGHKQREGDYKTPEGQYKLIRRNPRSDFFLSMEISYPNGADLSRAHRQGVKPGGAIMLHGWPNIPRKTADYYKSADWTDGCIAVANADMVEIWLMTPLETPIEIVP
jgi:murein L,D-transpeptidase YafK